MIRRSPLDVQYADTLTPEEAGMLEVSYILRLRVGVGSWSFQDLCDLVPSGFIDPGTWLRPISLHSLTKQDASLYFSILTEYYGAQVTQEVQRGVYRG